MDFQNNEAIITEQKSYLKLLIVIFIFVSVGSGGWWWFNQSVDQTNLDPKSVISEAVEVDSAEVLTAPTSVGPDPKSDQSSRAQCFSTLKDNLTEAGIFTDPLVELNKMSYQDIEPKFSQNYKSLTSFGIELDKGNIEMRVYSFGQQTGYIHPPKLPFPSSYESDTWIGPTKEFIVAEEYVIDASAQKHFITCSFFSIGAEDLLKVTRENYSYDGAMVSLAKTASDSSYKAWYSKNTSFDYQDKPFVNWTRLFIYPKSTQNTYFDKYSVADAFPANKVQSFDVLKFFLKNIIEIRDYDEAGAAQVKYLTPDSNGNFVEANNPQELLPINPEGVNKMFPLATYYQAIQNHFPEFASTLSLRGTLKYDTYKQLLSAQKVNPEIGKLLSTLTDPRQLARYSLDKESKAQQGMEVSDPEMDKILSEVKDVDAIVSRISQEDKALENFKNEKNRQDIIMSWMVTLLIAISILAVASLAVILWRKRKALNNPIN